ncbi:hypothetical protein WJX81_004698 [Elliptochloris bilobata]|uniref:Pseudouridine synthase I TruA alpha/beta domain-containing protein n=1 Tax=Elliptochloris bilobata TaxID=381761 RepID=A0AAW1SJW2_9CHLO
MAYIGTAYKGLQLQRTEGDASTVEGVLETALFRAGSILESNMGSLSKLGWSRSSRTDKGVHSVATVVACKLEIDVEDFQQDSEGLRLAQSINAHLPPEVRVLSVQRVNRSFNARNSCNSRTYHYYLPASIMGLRLDGSTEDAAVLERLQAALSLFVGTHPFHNFTQRRLYRPGAPGQKNKWRTRHPWKPAAAGSAAEGAGADDDDAPGGVREDEDAEEEEKEAPEDLKAPSSSEAGQPDGAAGLKAERRLRRSLTEPLDMSLRWLEERDLADPVSRGHSRILSIVEAASPAALLPGGPPCLQVTVEGTSFMLHQIRHMIGAAVLVARGQAPLAWLRAVLTQPARSHVPLAPPQVLVLADADFFPFRLSAPVAKLSGAALRLREGALLARHAFCKEVLYPALQPLLQDASWARWDATLSRVTHSAELEVHVLLSNILD